eukprot:4524512-Alexandrium_andersonii.AAC.1
MLRWFVETDAEVAAAAGINLTSLRGSVSAGMILPSRCGLSCDARRFTRNPCISVRSIVCCSTLRARRSASSDAIGPGPTEGPAMGKMGRPSLPGGGRIAWRCSGVLR